MLKDFLKRSRTVLFVRVWLSKMYETFLWSRHLANRNRKDPVKMHTDLFIRMHAIEKGMSIGEVKSGFGKNKVLALLSDLQHYLSIGGSRDFATKCCGVITEYLAFNKAIGADMGCIAQSLDKFCKSQALVLTINRGGVKQVELQTVKMASTASFECFSQSRFSIRDFGNIPIEKDAVCKALTMCERTPSACNRQSWRIYVFTDPDKRQLLFDMQLGCKGFSHQMQYAILICSDIRGYNINELHLAYVDGGLYAMNLLYALYSCGVATIPLTMSHMPLHIRKIKKRFNIPDFLEPVLLIGVGSYKDCFRVACSERKPYQSYTEFV